MRLIDADKFADLLDEQMVKETGVQTKAYNRALRVAKSLVKNPDAIATEGDESVKHGHWERIKKHLWRIDPDTGEVDEFAICNGYHNGPVCEKCGYFFCEHCNPDGWNDECQEEHYKCSVCGKEELSTSNYCSNCGAKMEEAMK